MNKWSNDKNINGSNYVNNIHFINQENQNINDIKYKITRVNINSGDRNIIPKNITSNNNILLDAPFNLIYNSSIITIKLLNHNLHLNDKIVISNVKGQYFYLNQIELFEQSSYIKIYHPNHGMLPNTKIIYRILISEFTNNRSTYLFSIPLNSINDYHIIYFNIDNSNTYDTNYYYINTKCISLINYLSTDLYFKIEYLHLYGIPINCINADYPITSNKNYGYHIVTSIIDNNTFTIDCNYISCVTKFNCGNNNVIINKIIDTLEGYPDNNSYTINLNKTFFNVKKIKLISSEFPNTEKVISNNYNNKLYWQLIGDGDYIYSIDITPGNYTVDTLKNEMISQIQNTKILHSNTFTSDSNYEYSSTFITRITINDISNIFTIIFYGQITIENPFKISQNNINNNLYYIEVYHPNHLLQSGIKIIILNSTDIGRVSADVINGEHTIYSIINTDRYLIKLSKFNLLKNSADDIFGGGLAVKIQYPYIARLLFNTLDTIGNNIGFRNVGNFDSITQWKYLISNNDPYYNDSEILTDYIGRNITTNVITNYITLVGNNYILMTNELIKNSGTTGVIGSIGNTTGIFAKILLTSPPGYMLYNQHIQLGDTLKDGIDTLAELSFVFYNQAGNLYSFYGVEHSFTLEIYEEIII